MNTLAQSLTAVPQAGQRILQQFYSPKQIFIIMKGILAAIILLLAAGCFTRKELTVEMISAQLVRIDTIYTESSRPMQQLTWRDQDDIEYTSIVSMKVNFPVGVTLDMLRQR